MGVWEYGSENASRLGQRLTVNGYSTCGSKSHTQSCLHGKCPQTIRNQIAFVVKVLARERCCNSDVTGKIISEREFQSGSKVSLQIRAGGKRDSIIDNFTV